MPPEPVNGSRQPQPVAVNLNTVLHAIVEELAVGGAKPMNGQAMMMCKFTAVDGCQVVLAFPVTAAEQLGRAIIDGAAEIRLANAGLHGPKDTT